ncbi:putative GTP-binding protein EngB [Nitrospira sp. KM1]|uniref:ribosome biogenesis GTP-binding protein YihA/YsxC n=1 Tax=Nitrospira sp. KM1 TaxID=1936990 RepID=UPI0013A73B18|nr:ribosome biogenesis GTP-binding protein YihA/YsxC [Nitrospira sp. KM1]BCA55154.1 putative GTP-binding protein EngB [Nitrospira sp. KM1]
MKILKAEFIKSCVSPKEFPVGGMPEIAFVGRSNVGKSSLINSLLQRRGLAKVSRTPGKTRAVNIFSVATDDSALPRFLLVDLPGYGYAKVSKTERLQWAPLIEQYLVRQTTLYAVVLLIESRVVGKQDRETRDWLMSVGHRPVVVATKVDKVRPSERVATLRRVQQEIGLSVDEGLIPYSSATGEGRDRLWSALKAPTQT